MGIESFIADFVILFQEHHSVLPHGNLKILIGPVLAQNEGQGSVGRGTVMGVHMDGDKQVGFRFVGDLGPFPEFNENISFPGVDYLDIGDLFFNVGSQFKGNSQCEVLFLGPASFRSRIFPAMTGIDHHGMDPLRFHIGTARKPRFPCHQKC